MTERDELIEATIAFIDQIKDKTPGAEMERWLNDKHGPGSTVYEDLAGRVRRGSRRAGQPTSRSAGGITGAAVFSSLPRERIISV